MSSSLPVIPTFLREIFSSDEPDSRMLARARGPILLDVRSSSLRDLKNGKSL